MNQTINEDILIKFILGEATKEEGLRIESWIAENPEHKKQYDHYKTIWETSKRVALESQVDENEAWERFKQRQSAHNREPANEVKPLKQWIHQSFWIKSAAILVLISIGVWVSLSIFTNPMNATLTISTLNEIRTDTLSDGSIVTLNKNTVLSYPKNFAKNKRSVTLKEGEAFFTIIPNATQPFTIDVNAIEVKVLGTSFNIKTEKDRTEVIVESGLVEVSKKDLMIHLKKDERIKIDRATHRFEKTINTDQLYKYYRNNTFVANNTPLWKLVEVLNDAYGVDIIIQGNSLQNIPINTTFKNQSLDEILSIICETLAIKSDRDGDRIFLRN